MLLQTLNSLRTFKSAGIHCPSAYIITSLAMVFLELRERQAQRERVADKGDHQAAGLQRKASLIPVWRTTVCEAAALTVYALAPALFSKGRTAVSPVLPGSLTSWQPACGAVPASAPCGGCLDDELVSDARQPSA